MSPLLQPVQDYARGAICALRAALRTALRRGALIGAALLIALMGAAFLIFAGYIGLRFLVGPGLAALSMGAALLALAAGMLLLARSAKRTAPPIAIAPSQSPPKAARAQPTPAQPDDAATMAVFTAAFLLGRQLAEHLADRQSRSGNS